MARRCGGERPPTCSPSLQAFTLLAFTIAVKAGHCVVMNLTSFAVHSLFRGRPQMTYMQATHAPYICRDDSESTALPAVGFGPVLRREEGVKCAVHRLQCSAVYKPLLARTGNLPTPQLYISLRPARWTGDMLHCASCRPIGSNAVRIELTQRCTPLSGGSLKVQGGCALQSGVGLQSGICPS